MNITYLILPHWLRLLVFFKSFVVPCWPFMFHEVESQGKLCLLCFLRFSFRLNLCRAILYTEVPHCQGEEAYSARYYPPWYSCSLWTCLLAPVFMTSLVAGPIILLFSAWGWRRNGENWRMKFLMISSIILFIFQFYLFYLLFPPSILPASPPSGYSWDPIWQGGLTLKPSPPHGLTSSTLFLPSKFYIHFQFSGKSILNLLSRDDSRACLLWACHRRQTSGGIFYIESQRGRVNVSSIRKTLGPHEKESVSSANQCNYPTISVNRHLFCPCIQSLPFLDNRKSHS